MALPPLLLLLATADVALRLLELAATLALDDELWAAGIAPPTAGAAPTGSLPPAPPALSSSSELLPAPRPLCAHPTSSASANPTANLLDRIGVPFDMPRCEIPTAIWDNGAAIAASVCKQLSDQQLHGRQRDTTH